METYNLSTELYSNEDRSLKALISTYDERDMASLDVFVDELDEYLY